MRFNVEEAIRKRTSVRTYSSKMVDRETQDKILNYADTIDNPLGSVSRFKFIDKKSNEDGEKLGTYGVITGAELYLGAAVKDETFSMESLGYELEELILYMTSLGFGTCWLGGTFNKGAFAKEMNLEENEAFPIITPVGYQAGKRSFAEIIMQSAVKPRKRMPWEKLFFFEGFDIPLTKEQAGLYELPLEMVRLAPSAVNRQPWRVVLKDNNLHFFKASADKKESSNLDLQRLDVGIALCHFNLTAKECGIDGKIERKCPQDIDIPDNMTYIASWVKK